MTTLQLIISVANVGVLQQRKRALSAYLILVERIISNFFNLNLFRD
jgi:hypothetical protein